MEPSLLEGIEVDNVRVSMRFEKIERIEAFVMTMDNPLAFTDEATNIAVVGSGDEVNF